MVLAEASLGNDIFLLDRIWLDIRSQIGCCAPFQLMYNSQLGKVPEFCLSRERILVPGSPGLVGAGTAHPPFGYSKKRMFQDKHPSTGISNSDF
jgi:hypothetical protein